LFRRCQRFRHRPASADARPPSAPAPEGKRGTIAATAARRAFFKRELFIGGVLSGFGELSPFSRAFGKKEVARGGPVATKEEARSKKEEVEDARLEAAPPMQADAERGARLRKIWRFLPLFFVFLAFFRGSKTSFSMSAEDGFQWLSMFPCLDLDGNSAGRTACGPYR
jgi:hypothetical protein